MNSPLANRSGGRARTRGRFSLPSLKPMRGLLQSFLFLLLSSLAGPASAALQAEGEARHAGGEANLVVPPLGQVDFLGMPGSMLLTWGLLVCLLGMGFGLWMYVQLRDLPVHRAMLEISELIYETCKTYLIQQIKFVAVLEGAIAAVIIFYFGFLQGYIADNDVPVNPLLLEGYTSIGCMPCTSKPTDPNDPRSGRWVGLDKSECGLHGLD